MLAKFVTKAVKSGTFFARLQKVQAPDSPPALWTDRPKQLRSLEFCPPLIWIIDCTCTEHREVRVDGL